MEDPPAKPPDPIPDDTAAETDKISPENSGVEFDAGASNNSTATVNELGESNEPSIMKDREELSPSKVNRQLPFSPLNPRDTTTLHSPARRDYRVLYEDLKRKTLAYTKKTDLQLANHQNKYDSLVEKYEAEIESYKVDPSEREDSLAAENQALKEKIEQLQEEHKTAAEAVKTEYEQIISAKEKLLMETNAELDSLRNVLGRGKRTHLTRGENEELFRSKPRRTGKKNTAIPDPLKCQIAECDNDDGDALVKCNGCGVWVCEGCHDVPIAKLKQVMNKCQTVYFACKS